MREAVANTDPIEELVERAGEGDRAAFQEIVDRFRPVLLRQIRARAGRQALLGTSVEDLLQDTFAGALESIGKIRWQGEEAFQRWLGSIAEHLIYAASRKSARSPLRLEREPPADVVSPSRNLRRVERLKRLEEALEKLRPDHRQVLFLSRIELLKTAEIAERMGRSPNAVKKLPARALIELKRHFGKTESLHLPDRRLEAGGAADVDL